MKILIEYKNLETTNNYSDYPSNFVKSPKYYNPSSYSQNHRNITNIFNLTAITRELKSKGINNIEFLPKKKLKNNLYAMYIRTPYEGKSVGFTKDQKDGAKVALVVDYDTNEALAISRSGSDKREMLLIADIANKHINEPFKINRNLRSKL